MIKKDENTGLWKLDIRPDGYKGRRIIKTFKRKSEAVNYEKALLAGKIKLDKPSSDNRRLTDLIEEWFKGHGQTLKTARATKMRVVKLAQNLGNPVFHNLTPTLFIAYRSQRLADGITPATLNRELSTIRAVISELDRMGVIDTPNPFSKIRQLKEAKTELNYLNHDEIQRLLLECQASRNTSLYHVARLCLVTGARWSEAEGIRRSHLKDGRVQYVDTKNSKNRFVVLDSQLEMEIAQHLDKHGKFESCYSAFRKAIERAGIETLPGQLSHILRHTFASHYMINGGHILSLQRILGHSSLVMTMRYAHLSPDFQNEVKKLNPLQCGKNVESATKA